MSNDKKYDIAVVIGRFEPFHNLHKKLVDHALGLAKKVVIILGSHKSAPDIKNPFTSESRAAMIMNCFNAPERQRLSFKPVRDHFYAENLWISEVQNIVREAQEAELETRGIKFEDVQHNSALLDIKVALVGHMKDETSYYLKMFPQWTFESMYVQGKESQTLSATDIRALMFQGDRYDAFVPEPVAHFLDSFKLTQPYVELKKEFDFNRVYKQNHRYVNAPYDSQFITTDACVTAMGHVLLVRRGFNPGKGLVSLPGGFAQPDLFLIDNSIKELKEETHIKVNSETLKARLKNQHVFDHPYRSLRGRTVTHAFHFDLNPNLIDGLPIVKGGDDADKAFWLPISSLTDYEDKFFEDHFEIVRFFLGV
jgi:bifunctional NMN adenylyltransferase/nudix hydrolase